MGDKWERVPLTPNEITKVIDAAQTLEERVAMTFLADTGCRVNELLRMNKTWFDFNVGAKYGVVNIQPKPIEEGRARVKTPVIKHIPLTRRLTQTMHDWFVEHDMVYKSPVWVYNVCKRCAKRAGVAKTLTPHVFRHSYITNAFYSGNLKPLEIAKLAGHVDSGMVEKIYLKIDDSITAKKLEASGWLD